MSKWIRSEVFEIGNSQGIRIPRTLLEQAGLTDEVEMRVEGNALIIHSEHSPRPGWEAQFVAMAENKEDTLLLDETIQTQWDEDEWQW
jgi:antitoxin MazE